MAVFYCQASCCCGSTRLDVDGPPDKHDAQMVLDQLGFPKGCEEEATAEVKAAILALLKSEQGGHLLERAGIMWVRSLDDKREATETLPMKLAEVSNRLDGAIMKLRKVYDRTVERKKRK